MEEFTASHTSQTRKRNWLDLQSEYIYQRWVAIHKFKPKSGLDGWKAIYHNANDHEVNKLIKYIKQTIGYKIYEYVNPDSFRTTTTEDGQRIHYTLVLEFESLDNILTQDTEGDGSNPVQLTDENSLFDNTMYYYYVTFFQKWYEEHREDILTNTQVKFLDDLKKCSKKPHLTPKEFEEVTGVRWLDYSRRLRKIEERVLRAWKKENPDKQTRRQVFDTKKVEYFQKYVDIIQNDSVPQAQNLLLTNHLIKGMNDNSVEKDLFEIIHDTLKGEKLVEFNRLCNSNNHRDVALTGASLYKITAVIEKKLEKLKEEQEKAVVEEPLVRPTPKKKAKKRRTEIKTYNKERKLIKHEHKLEKNHVKHANIYYLLPTGLSTQER